MAEGVRRSQGQPGVNEGPFQPPLNFSDNGPLVPASNPALDESDIGQQPFGESDDQIGAGFLGAEPELPIVNHLRRDPERIAEPKARCGHDFHQCVAGEGGVAVRRRQFLEQGLNLFRRQWYDRPGVSFRGLKPSGRVLHSPALRLRPRKKLPDNLCPLDFGGAGRRAIAQAESLDILARDPRKSHRRS